MAPTVRSVLAQLDYTYQINHRDNLGVPFKTHLHVPERHPDTNSVFCEREDEGHVFKVFKFIYVWLMLICKYLPNRQQP